MRNSYLTQQELQKFRKLLLVKRDELLGVVNSIEVEVLGKDKSDLSRIPIDLADKGTDNYEIENTLGLMDSERKLIAEIDDALDRITKGFYGICEGSGKPIPKQRLKAIPWARYCVEYASLLEKKAIRIIPSKKIKYYRSFNIYDQDIDFENSYLDVAEYEKD